MRKPPNLICIHPRKMLKVDRSVRVWHMVRLSAGIALLAGMTISQVSLAAQSPGEIPAVQSLPAQTSRAGLPPLPPPPTGRSTVEGGTIGSVDPVRDQLTLNVYGTKPMKILYDERTLVYRDGVKAPLSDLRPHDHASVQTVLDGTKIFALSIHMLSHAPEGETQGQVQAYDAGTGNLTMTAALSGQPINLRVPAGISVVGVGQVKIASPTAGLQDLVKGTLISVQFDSTNNGRGIARQISILATPGSSFVFTGNVVSLDLAANRLVLLDPRDNRSYSITFDPGRFAMSRNLHVGTHVMVTTNFDGSHYVASSIKII